MLGRGIISCSPYMCPMLGVFDLFLRSTGRNWSLTNTAEVVPWRIGFPTFSTMPIWRKRFQSLTARALAVLPEIVLRAGRTIPISFLETWLRSGLRNVVIKLGIAGLTIFRQPRIFCTLLSTLSLGTGGRSGESTRGLT